MCSPFCTRNWAAVTFFFFGPLEAAFSACCCCCFCIDQRQYLPMLCKIPQAKRNRFPECHHASQSFNLESHRYLSFAHMSLKVLHTIDHILSILENIRRTLASVEEGLQAACGGRRWLLIGKSDQREVAELIRGTIEVFRLG